MLNLWRLKAPTISLAFALVAFSAPAWCANTNVGRPGTVNYIEGQVSLDGQQLDPSAIGSAEMRTGQVISTGQGKAEVLLTPGVFLRLGDQSAVRMDSPALTDTRVAVMQGKAMIEVDQLYKQNNIQVLNGGATTMLLKPGLYAFTAQPGKVQVYDGEARVVAGDHNKTLKKGHEVMLANNSFQKASFDRNSTDPLYAWSSLRSEYMSEASAASARTYIVDGGWYGDGWYWNPWFGAYAFLPGDGFLYGPFGWGFFSPAYAFYAPGYGYGYGYGFHGGRVIGGVHRPALRAGAGRSFAGPAIRGGGFHGGGFGGGFHGGGFGGGGGRGR